MYKISDREQALRYLKDIRTEVGFLSLVFVISVVIGYVIAILYPEIVMKSFQELEGLAGILKSLPPIQIMFLIFLNNALKSLFILVLGVGLGLVPFIFIAYNGYFLGIFINKILMEQGPLYLVAGLLPHGIIEIPMVIISAAIGMRLGRKGFAALRGETVQLKDEMIAGVKFFFYWILPLLFIAAAVETFVTSAIIGLLSQP